VSDYSQGPGWWQASDGKWYPPEQAPGYQTPQPGVPFAGGPVGGADVGTSLSWGWNKFTQNIGELIVIWAIIFGVQLLFRLIGQVAGIGIAGVGEGFLIGIGLSVVQWAVVGVLYIVLARAALTIADGRRVNIGEAFQLSGPPLTAGIVFGLIIGVGLALCVLPGVVAYFLLAFTPIIAVAQNRGADALGEAFTFGTSDFGNTFLLLLVVALLSACTCGLGAPLGFLALAHNYRVRRNEPLAP
jgi:hypothetical protein